ncbi:MAG: ATP-binding cassette domain-containing protein [Bacteroidetes bacterium]|nr:ATP-binding cassette domain-containing protein [Bacteroidota bacterium]
MISVNQLTIEFGGFELFKNISFFINSNDKIGLVGKNGAGKTTLLKAIVGLQKATKGVVALSQDMKIGYLPQNMLLNKGKTVIDEALDAFSDVLDIENDINKINNQIINRTDYESDDYMNLINQLTEKNEQFNILGGNTLHANVEQTLIGLGFANEDFNRQTTEFSGGWRMRIELAKILLRKPDLILLDEPTNHLDIVSIEWLEDYLKNYKGAVLLVSHDRIFLDNITKRTIEISMGEVYDYKVSYSKFRVLRKERIEQQLAAYKNQQKKIDETTQFINRFRYQATKAVQVQSRIKQLDKMKVIEIDVDDDASIKFKFPPAPRSGLVVVETKHLVKKYDEKVILNDVNFTIERGEHVSFVGKNGEGKSTLSKIICGELQYDGEMKIGHNVNVGYFAQNQTDMLNKNKTVFQTIDDVAVGDIRTKIRDVLAAFLFRGDDIDKKVEVLSGGEKARLAFIRLLLQPYNLLVLDEPTNHLDIQSKDIIKQSLISYTGTLIVVSHDRYFLDGLSEKVYEFKDKNIKQYIGGIHEFLENRRLASFQELEKKNREIKTAPKEEKNTSNKLLYKKRKEFERKITKVESNIKKSESKISGIEKDIANVDNLFANPEQNEDVDSKNLYKKYDWLKNELEKEMSIWEQLNQEKEDLISQKQEFYS